MKAIVSILFLSGLVTIAGCTTNPSSFGDRVLAEGETRIEMAEQWEQGKNESITGERRVKDGRKLVEKGRADLRKGEELIASGNVEVQTNRKIYQSLSQTALGINSGELALKRVTKLRKTAKDWEDGDAKIVEGNKLIQRGNTKISEGEAEISKGQKLIVSGRDKMLAAESSYQKKIE